MKYYQKLQKSLKKIKKEENTILVTSSSYSKDKSVLPDLQKYTRLLSKELNVSESFFIMLEVKLM